MMRPLCLFSSHLTSSHHVIIIIIIISLSACMPLSLADSSFPLLHASFFPHPRLALHLSSPSTAYATPALSLSPMLIHPMCMHMTLHIPSGKRDTSLSLYQDNQPMPSESFNNDPALWLPLPLSLAQQPPHTCILPCRHIRLLPVCQQ